MPGHQQASCRHANAGQTTNPARNGRAAGMRFMQSTAESALSVQRFLHAPESFRLGRSRVHPLLRARASSMEFRLGPMPSARNTRGALVRYSLLVTLVAMGGALVASAWANRRQAGEVSATLDQGQSDRFFRSVIEIHDRERRGATREELAGVLEGNREEGLRYVGLLDRGVVVAEAGKRSSVPITDPGRGGPRTLRIGE